MISPDDDERFMRRALELAERGRGLVEPNPLVGAVVAHCGEILGEGWHRRFGESHAEVEAVLTAGCAARNATLYVTLEPCCHHGKTPPCTDEIRRAGIARVVAAMVDPFPEVAGRGIQILRDTGIRVDVGICRTEAERLNRPFITLVKLGRPCVHAKWAMTLDGKVATRSGASKWISGEASRQRVHELRGRMDAVIVGAGTVRADDPLLTARPPGPRRPMRIVLSTSGELPSHCRLLNSPDDGPVLIATLAGRGAALKSAGCGVFECPDENGRPSVSALLLELGRRRMTNVLVEGGPEVLGSFRDAGRIDAVHVFIAPRLMGGIGAKSPFGGQGTDRLSDALDLADWRIETIGDDCCIRGWTRSPYGESS